MQNNEWQLAFYSSPLLTLSVGNCFSCMSELVN